MEVFQYVIVKFMNSCITISVSTEVDYQFRGRKTSVKKNWRKWKFPQWKFSFWAELRFPYSVKNVRRNSVPSTKRKKTGKIPRNSVWKCKRNSAGKIPRSSVFGYHMEFHYRLSYGIPYQNIRQNSVKILICTTWNDTCMIFFFTTRMVWK